MKATLFSAIFLASSLFMPIMAINNSSSTTNQVLEDSVKAKPRVDENGIWLAPYQLPQFKGGVNAMMEYLTANLHRPTGLDSIQGFVTVRFVVTEKGKISKPEIIRSLHPSFDEEVLRVIQAMPDWIPGKNDGKEVSVYMNLPVRFR